MTVRLAIISTAFNFPFKVPAKALQELLIYQSHCLPPEHNPLISIFWELLLQKDSKSTLTYSKPTIAGFLSSLRRPGCKEENGELCRNSCSEHW